MFLVTVRDKTKTVRSTKSSKSEEESKEGLLNIMNQ